MRALISSFCFLMMGMISCREDPVEILYTTFGEGRGVYISCEGNFLYGNASLSHYDQESRRVFNQLFFARNRAPLGDVAQSMASDGKNLFVVVNNSGKVVVLDLRTLEYKGSLKGLVSPRHLLLLSAGKAYISDLYARGITVFHPGTFEKLGFIPLPGGASQGGHSTEFFVRSGNFVFVSCWMYDNKILVINTENDALVDSITVPRQPGKMVLDKNGKIWVITDGDYQGGTTGFDRPSLARIDPNTRTVEQLLVWNLPSQLPRDIEMNPARDTLYIIAGDLYKMAVGERRLPSEPFLKAGSGNFYSMGVDQASGEIFVGNAIDFSQNGLVYRFSSAGIQIDSFRVGINPGDFLFH